MAIVILIAFLTLPLVEITLFIIVGDALGLGVTIGLVVLSALGGIWLLRYLGFTALQRLQEGLARQEYPEVELFNAVCLFAASVLLIVPGFFTDGLGLLLFLPGLRNRLSHIIFDRLVSSGVVFVHGGGSFSEAYSETHGEDGEDGPIPRPGGGEGHIIEGEFEDLTANKKEPTPPALGDDNEQNGGEEEGAAGGDETPPSS